MFSERIKDSRLGDKDFPSVDHSCERDRGVLSPVLKLVKGLDNHDKDVASALVDDL